ncbi:MAG: division/cell wall cluster transcriptional repressor MraZ [Alphaproteobacteria bacterium]
MTSFLSTFVNKVDRKGRVSVPAQFRTALSNETFQGVIVYPSLSETAIDGFGRSALEDLNRRRMDKTLEDGDFERALLGGDMVIDTIMAMAHELPFDGEGRIVLPATLAEPAGITDRTTFVGRGTRFQIWAPDAFEQHQQAAVTALRQRLSTQGNNS